MATQPQLQSADNGDVNAIFTLLKGYADSGNLLPRSPMDIEQHLGQFVIVRYANQIAACAALEIFTDDLAEVRSLAVADQYKHHGFGSLLVRQLTENARQRGLTRLMALTYVPGFFHQLGFQTVSKSVFPEKVWGVCIKCYKFHNCDEVAMLLKL